MITRTLIRSYAETYSLDELKAMRKKAMDELAEMDYISQASTGAGAQYTVTQRIKLEELIELLTCAIDEKEDNTQPDGGYVHPIIFY